MIDPLAFIPPAELPPDAATETTLAVISQTLSNPIAVTGELTLDDSTPLAIDKAGLATTAGQEAIAQAILDSEPDVSALAKETTLSQLKASLELQAKLTDSQPVDLRVGSSAIATGSGATNAQTLRFISASDSPLNALTGQLNDAPPASDIAPSSLNGRLQRVAQNLTSLTSVFRVAGQFLAQSIGIALPRKETITGTATTTAAANANLLSGTAIATDVRDYNSAELTIISTATTGSYTIQCCHDEAFAGGVTTLQVFESTVQAQNPINAAVTPTASTRRFGLNLTGINYIRVNLTTGAVGVQAIAVLSQMAFVPNQTNVQQAVGASLQTAVSALPTLATVTTVNTVAASQSAAQSAAVVDVASAAITATATTSAFTPTWGVSQIFSVVVSALSGTAPTLDVVVQESPDGGTTWIPVHTFAQITAIGTYNSPLIAQAGRAYRYVQTIGGTTPSFTRTINRYASNVAILPSFSDIFRLRANAPRKPAAVTLTTTTVADLIPAPSNPAHRHVICWIGGQNATDTPTIAEFTGGAVPIKVVAPSKGSGRDFSVDQQIMTLPAGAAFRVGQSVATTFEASCGYYTIDATGAPV